MKNIRAYSSFKANTLWPAMHQYSNAFHLDAENAVLADKYGIVMGSSHAEPLLRNNLGELYPYQQQWLADHPDKKLYINTKDDSADRFHICGLIMTVTVMRLIIRSF